MNILTLFFLIIGMGFIIVTLLLKKTDALLWVFLTSFIFPNHGDHLFGINGLPLFFYFQLAQGLALLMVIWSSKVNASANSQFINRESRLFFQLFILVFMLQYTVGVLWITLKGVEHVDVDTPILYGHIFSAFLPFVFFYGCSVFIKSLNDIHRFLKLLTWISFGLFLEFIGSSIPGVKQMLRYSINDAGLFQSIFLNDSLAVGVTASMSFLSSLYLYMLTRKNSYLLLSITNFILLLATFTRGILYAVIIASVLYLYQSVRSKTKLTVILCVLSVCGYSMNYFLLEMQGSPIEIMQLPFQIINYKLNENTASYGSYWVRLGMQLNGLSVLGQSFPFGVGNDMLRFYMPQNALEQADFENPYVMEGINRLADGIITETHNGYLEFIASYGLPGLLVLGFLMARLRVNIFVKIDDKNTSLIRDTIAAMLVFFAVYFFSYGYPTMHMMLYFLFVSALHIGQLLRISNAPEATFKKSMSPQILIN